MPVGGGAFSDARYDAAYLHNPEPPYPAMSKKMRETGRVTLRVFVLASGSASRVEIKNSSGFVRLDESARATVLEKWRFVPARRGNENVDAWVNLSISFNLRS
jgi:protein TonB